MAPRKAEWWWPLRESWVCRCATLGSGKRLGIYCPLIRRSLSTPCSPEDLIATKSRREAWPEILIVGRCCGACLIECADFGGGNLVCPVTRMLIAWLRYEAGPKAAVALLWPNPKKRRAASFPRDGEKSFLGSARALTQRRPAFQPNVRSSHRRKISPSGVGSGAPRHRPHRPQSQRGRSDREQPRRSGGRRHAHLRRPETCGSARAGTRGGNSPRVDSLHQS